MFREQFEQAARQAVQNLRDLADKMNRKNEGLVDFLETLRYWLSTFPRVYVCETCGRKVWLIGRSGAPVFCGRECFESEHGVKF